MHTLLVIILSLGIVLIKAFWIATDARSKNERMSFQMLKSNAIEAIILLVQVVSSLFIPWPLNGVTEFLVTFGIVMYVAGFILAMWARLTMREHWGAPGILDKKRQKELVTSGPFRLSRNPIYVGFLLLYFGHALATRSYFIVLRLPLAYYFIQSIKREEKLLSKEYGKKYDLYTQKVPRYL